MSALYNSQPVLGVRLVADGTKMYLGRTVVGLRSSGAAFSDNQQTLGVAVLGADQPLYNDQPVVGAVLISDARTIYNGQRIAPAFAVSGVLA